MASNTMWKLLKLVLMIQHWIKTGTILEKIVILIPSHLICNIFQVNSIFWFRYKHQFASLKFVQKSFFYFHDHFSTTGGSLNYFSLICWILRLSFCIHYRINVRIMGYFSTFVKFIKICVNLCFIINFLKV